MESQDTGKIPFMIMIAIIAFLFVVCIVCPLAVPGWSKQPFGSFGRSVHCHRQFYGRLHCSGVRFKGR